MDADDHHFANSDEAAELEARTREVLGQMGDINAKIGCVMNKLKRLENVKKHLKASFESRFKKIEVRGQYAGRWRRSEVEFNSRLVETVKDKADRLEDAVDDYFQGPLDPVLEGVDSEGLKSETRVLVDLRKRVVEAEPVLDFSSLLKGWVLQPMTLATQRALLVRHNLVAREARIKENIFTMLVFLMLFLMEPEERAEEYRKFVTKLEDDVVANPRMKLIGKFLSLVTEIRRRCRGMPNLRRITRNILECYSSMGFLEREVNEFLETLVERMEHMDTVLFEISRSGGQVIAYFVNLTGARR